jgi:hypothetical protein
MLVPEPVKKKFTIKAVIPTAQYGNLQPEYEVEAESYEEAEKIAMPYIEKLWATYCQPGAELKPRTAQPKVSAEDGKPKKNMILIEMVSELTGGKARFHEASHTYFNSKGAKMLSGSKFAKQFEHDFAKEKILAEQAEKYGVNAAEIEEMWKLKGDASASFGTAVHAALEMYGKFIELGKKTGATKKPVVNSALHDNPMLKKIVEKFFEKRLDEKALYEAPVVDEARDLVGQIDRLKIVDLKKKIVRVQDYKTNLNVNKKGFNGTLLTPFDNMKDTPLNGYWLQLSFYADILKAFGWTVEALDVFHWDGQKEEWVTYTHEPIDLSEVLNKK